LKLFLYQKILVKTPELSHAKSKILAVTNILPSKLRMFFEALSHEERKKSTVLIGDLSVNVLEGQ